MPVPPLSLARLEYDFVILRGVPVKFREDLERSILFSIHTQALRSLVPSPGIGRWQWRVVVPLFADESWSRRLPGRAPGDAASGLGHMVSEGGKATKLHSRFSDNRFKYQLQRAKPVLFANG